MCKPDSFSKERFGLRIALLMGKCEPQSLKSGHEFRSRDLAFGGKYLPETLGPGVAVLDFA